MEYIPPFEFIVKNMIAPCIEIGFDPDKFDFESFSKAPKKAKKKTVKK